VIIQFEWPVSRQPLKISKKRTIDNALTLDIVSGAIDAHDAHLGHDSIVFYWHMSRLVIVNLCVSAICLMDGAEVAYGHACSLQEATSLQAGHFKLLVTNKDEGGEATPSLNQLLCLNGDSQTSSRLLNVEEILSKGGNYINDLRYFNDVIMAQEQGDDVLKTLELEYKRFLIWQELDDGGYSESTHHGNRILKTDHRFDSGRELFKDKSLTECIIATEFLMEKVWADLERSEEWYELFMEEEKVDLLHALSPEHIVAKNKDKVPELVFQDFYKVGLDSFY